MNATVAGDRSQTLTDRLEIVEILSLQILAGTGPDVAINLLLKSIWFGC